VLLADVAAGKGMALLADSFRALRLAGVAYRPLRGRRTNWRPASAWPGGKSTAMRACPCCASWRKNI